MGCALFSPGHPVPHSSLDHRLSCSNSFSFLCQSSSPGKAKSYSLELLRQYIVNEWSHVFTKSRLLVEGVGMRWAGRSFLWILVIEGVDQRKASRGAAELRRVIKGAGIFCCPLERALVLELLDVLQVRLLTFPTSDALDQFPSPSPAQLST